MYERASGWLTSRHTLVLTHTQAHTRSRVTLHTSFVHSKGNLCISACLRVTSTKHTHMHNLYFSQPLAFCLLLSYTLIGMQACAQKESKSLCSQLLFLSSTHTGLQPTHFLCDLLECHSIFVTAVAYPSDLTTSHQWALTDIADLFSDETDIKADLIVHQISSLWLRLISYFFIKKKTTPHLQCTCSETQEDWEYLEGVNEANAHGDLCESIPSPLECPETLQTKLQTKTVCFRDFLMTHCVLEVMHGLMH